ncbi:dynein assembly factor 4, axonemal [Brienomyrus brachyistius]|uniref:dynein assembly factor 4, axonemal n=1 Tax=Brienomyrus brachyistius TaxID=42636 RepID=UPI0020B195B1|nr:dynein assembly factor 4, axonemal [Brienomyrus brachyistius]
MPLLVKDYSWTQTPSSICLTIPLKGTNPRKVDVFATDEYLKVHFPPFLLEVFFSEAIDDDTSVAKIGNGVAVLTLRKKEDRMWEQLTINDADKKILKSIRERAVLKAQEKSAADSTARAEKKQQENKYTLEKMMKIEEEQRNNIEKLKADERERATAELEAWKLQQKREAEKEDARRNRQKQTQEQKTQLNHTSQLSSTKNAGTVKYQRKDSDKKNRTPLPAPRSSCTIKIQFTPRVFPTALRESRVPEEEEWLKKQADVRRQTNTDVSELNDLKEDERNPDWLKEKGNKLFVTGNYLAAVNAYNLAIQLNRKIPALYLNRAACHLKLKNLHKAIEDSSQALDLLLPAVADNADARMKAYVRRGTAFCELQLYAEGLQDYDAALKIDPYNQTVLSDAEKIRQFIQGSMPDHLDPEKKM